MGKRKRKIKVTFAVKEIKEVGDKIVFVLDSKAEIK